MEAYPLYVDPLDALAGRARATLYHFYQVRGGWNPKYAYPELRELHALYGIISGIGGPQHLAADLEMGLQLGWGGLLQKVRHHASQHGPEKGEFYQAEENILLGIATLIRRTCDEIRRLMATESDAVIRDNLRDMLAANEPLIDAPPQNFHQACQWLGWYGIASRAYNGDGASGRIDVLLEPYYKRDKAAGILDDERALFILQCMLLQDTRYWQLGGGDAHGNEVTSDFSFLVLQAAHRLGLACNLTVRVHEKMDRRLLLQSVRHLVEDRKGWPRYCGEDSINAGFVRNGYSMELARQRVSVGCHWTAIPGREYTLNDVVKINVAKVFEVAFWEMMDGPSPSVEELCRVLERHLRRGVLCVAEGFDLHLSHQWDNAPELVFNVLSHGPIEKGIDLTNGGVEFYNLCVDGCGLATVADSLSALEQRIEREGVLTWQQAAAHLRVNFEGPEGPRVRQMLKHSERFGQGGSRGDEWALRVSQLFTRIVKETRTPSRPAGCPDYQMIPGWFSWSNTIGLGRAMGATPNGRLAGEPISTGPNPDPGFRRDGAATAMVTAVAAVQCGYGNACPLQLELDPGAVSTEQGVAKVANLIETHFRLGGTVFNINIIDAQQLRAAYEDPSKCPEMIVRATGFTAYYASLSRDFQKLVLDRVIREQQ